MLSLDCHLEKLSKIWIPFGLVEDSLMVVLGMRLIRRPWKCCQFWDVPFTIPWKGCKFQKWGLPKWGYRIWFFPRASERRVLPIVGVCKTSSHLHIFSSSHLLIFTSSYPHMFSSSHLLIFTSSHIFSHLLTSSHIISHLLTSSHTSTHIFSHLHSHLLTSSHLLISHLLLLPSCPLALSFFSISLLKAGAGAVPTRQHETQPFRTKWRSIVKNWSKIAILLVLEQPFHTKWGSIVKNWSKIAILLVLEQPFHTKWGSIVKNWSKIAIFRVLEQPFRTKWGSIVKNWAKIAILLVPRATLSHEMRVDRQKLR